MEKMKFYLIAVVVSTQMASVAGRVYTDRNVARFRCTPQSPVRRPPDTYRLTTRRVTVSFPLTHVFCGEVRNGLAKGFHSTAAPQSNAQRPSAERVRQTNQAIVYDASNHGNRKFSTFFCHGLTVKGLSNCISKWAAECYNFIMRKNYAGDCMHLINIPNVNNGIEVFFRKGQQLVTLTTAYPPATPNAKCTRCLIPRNINTCNLRQ